MDSIRGNIPPSHKGKKVATIRRGEPARRRFSRCGASRRPSARGKCLVTGLLLLLCAVLGVSVATTGAPSHEFYFFNPDSSQSNLGNLTREMDSLLSRIDYPIAFQAFAHLLDFDNLTHKKRPSFLFLPDWYLKKYGDELGLRPFLVPVRKGKVEYKKVLMAAKTSDVQLENLADRSLAMTSMGPEGEAILNKILFSKHGIDARDLDAVIVPKDSDALFALVLGQVDTALVVKENMAQIAKINPRIVQAVRPLDESDSIPMPVLCYSEGVVSPSELQKIKEVFMGATSLGNRAKIMEMLQIDEWQPYTD